MAENTEQGYKQLEPPFNITDIFVEFDPGIPKDGIAKSWKSEEKDETSNFESTETNGFDTPIVKINQQVIPEEIIESMTIRFTDFTPTLELVIDDKKDDIQYIGGPGLHNHITVILCPNVEGLYRSISLLFYIKERINETFTKIKYICEYHNLGLEDCACMQFGDKPLTTFEFCEDIAHKLNMGFACTDKCKDVSDARWRQSYSQKVKSFIQEQVEIGGVDETAFFDVWIDTHGYLNLVNLAWVMDTNIKAENLSIKVESNIEIPVAAVPKNEPYEVQRTITDMPNSPISSLKITNKYSYLNTAESKSMGTDASFWILNSSGDQNILENQDVKVVDDSIEGKSEPQQYAFRKTEFIGCDQSEDLPYLMRKEIRKRWFQKRRTKRLNVCLLRPNFGIERGTLINVAIVNQEAAHIRRISQNFDNVTKENHVDNELNVVDDSATPVDLGVAASGEFGILNPALSGMYYIDGIIYSYDRGIGRVEQILFMIKKSEDNPLFHEMSSPVITTEQQQILDKNIENLNG